MEASIAALVILLVVVLLPLSALALMRLSSFLEAARIEKEHVVVNDILQGHVSSLMGHAYNMKMNNKEGKLSPEEQELLRDWVMARTRESINALLGKKAADRLNEQDLISRIGASVKMFKMQYSSSGLADLEGMMDALLESMSQDNDDEDEDDE